jgi:hypothetical protein
VASSIFKMSTFSIAVDNVGEMNSNKGQSGIFANPFLSKINFAQSKVLENGFDLAELKRMHQQQPPPLILPLKKTNAINPFD